MRILRYRIKNIYLPSFYITFGTPVKFISTSYNFRVMVRVMVMISIGRANYPYKQITANDLWCLVQLHEIAEADVDSATSVP